jgi:hypothetical protein
MKRFRLKRVVDDSGISGTGYVTEGIIWSDGTVAMRWLTHVSSHCYYNSIADVETIHGHGGHTVVEYID